MQNKRKWILILLVSVVAILIVLDVPLWFHLTGGGRKLWIMKRNYGPHIGVVHNRGPAMCFGWDLKKQYFEMIHDTAYVSPISDHFLTYRGAFIDFAWFRIAHLKESFPFAKKKVLFHSADSIAIYTKTFKKARAYYIGDSLVFDFMNKPDGTGYIFDTLYLIRKEMPKTVLNERKDNFPDFSL